jgi:hypothetical protein
VNTLWRTRDFSAHYNTITAKGFWFLQARLRVENGMDKIMSNDHPNGNVTGNGTRAEQALRVSELSCRRLLKRRMNLTPSPRPHEQAEHCPDNRQTV